MSSGDFPPYNASRDDEILSELELRCLDLLDATATKPLDWDRLTSAWDALQQARRNEAKRPS